MAADLEQEAADVLDNESLRKQLDPTNMLARIESLPDQCEDGWQNSAGLALQVAAASIDTLVVLGMGGSAIAGDILCALADHDGQKTVLVVRGYDLPAAVAEHSLAIACSHSGNTEETLSLVDQAIERGVPIVAVTTGGELAERASAARFPISKYAYEGEPRCALGYQLMALLRIAEQAGALDAQEASVREAISLMRALRSEVGWQTRASGNAAKGLAAKLANRLPVIIGSGVLAPVARRWRTQFSENSKCWALSDELPELGHNTVVGFGLPSRILPTLHAIFLQQSSLDQRVRSSIRATASELDLAGVSHEAVEAPGERVLAQTLTGLLFGDFVSYYLALLYGVDPSPVPPIVRLKAKLAGG